MPSTLLRRATSLLALAAGLCVSCAPSPHPDIVLITIDTLRADRLGSYGHQLARTPVLDGLASAGLRFASCTTPVPITLPAHASILTGRIPAGHGVRNNLTYTLPADVPTFVEALTAGGYRCGAFVSAFPLDARFGLQRGFETYDAVLPDADGSAFEFSERKAPDTVRAALEWVRRQSKDAPVFLWVHLFEPHAPYAPAPPFDRGVSDPYDGEVAAADAAIGHLLQAIQRDRGREPITVVTSDHGEGLGEHGEASHSFFLYESTLHVPLIVHAPGHFAAGVETEPVGLCDIAPTILGLAGVESTLGSIDGVALEPGRVAGRPQIAETLYGMEAFGWSPLFARRDGSHKVIRSAVSRVFDLAQDPGELRDLTVDGVPWAAAQFAALDATILSWTDRDASREPTPEEMEALAALGYAGGLKPTSTSSVLLEAVAKLPEGTERIDELSSITAAQELLRTGNPRAAIAQLESVLEASPGNGWAHSLLAGAYAAVGEHEASGREAAEGARRQPRRLSAQLQAARQLRDGGDLGGAAAHFLEAMDLAPADLEVVREAVGSLVKSGRSASALDALDRCILSAAAASGDILGQLNALLAVTCLQSGEVERGFPALAEARRLDDKPVLRVIEAQFHRAKQDWDSVVRVLDPLDGELQNDVQAHLLCLDALQRLDRHAELNALLGQARTRFPGDPRFN